MWPTPCFRVRPRRAMGYQPAPRRWSGARQERGGQCILSPSTFGPSHGQAGKRLCVRGRESSRASTTWRAGPGRRRSLRRYGGSALSDTSAFTVEVEASVAFRAICARDLVKARFASPEAAGRGSGGGLQDLDNLDRNRSKGSYDGHGFRHSDTLPRATLTIDNDRLSLDIDAAARIGQSGRAQARQKPQPGARSTREPMSQQASRLR